MNRRPAVPALALALLAALAVLPSAAQTAPSAYRIASVEYEIEGKTRQKALADRLDIRIGKEFLDLAALEAYVADRRQVLVNQRVLESAELTWEAREATGGPAAVTLTVRAKDTWNLIILPYPKYSTNEGLLLGLRLRDYNFAGTMETLFVDLDYRYDENGDQSFRIGTEFALPFELGGLDWTIDTVQGFAYNFSGRITYTGKNTLKLDLGGDAFRWTARVGQNFFWNEDGDLDDDLDRLVLQTLAGIGTEVDLADLGTLGALTLTPDLEAGWKYLADGGTISADRRGPYITASWTLGTGRADWTENFRQGTVLSLKNSWTYNFYQEGWDSEITAQARHYQAWNNRAGLNSRVTLYASLLDVGEDIGGYLRGVRDAALDGDYAAFVNLDLPVRLFDFKPSLLIRKDWFDFEVHASPFADAALVRASPSDPFEPYLCGGLEVFGFLKRARSVYARLSLGINALGYLDTRGLSGNYELFFGLGHDY